MKTAKKETVTLAMLKKQVAEIQGNNHGLGLHPATRKAKHYYALRETWTGKLEIFKFVSQQDRVEFLKTRPGQAITLKASDRNVRKANKKNTWTKHWLLNVNHVKVKKLERKAA